MSQAASRIWFYHLDRFRLDQVLPDLIERTLARGWRAIVRVADDDTRRLIDDGLWTWRPDGFIPHGPDDSPDAQTQPVIVTTGTGNVNGAQALFIVDGSDMAPDEEFERCLILFDGRDEAALSQARGRWRGLKAAGADPTYWQQTERGWRQAG